MVYRFSCMAWLMRATGREKCHFNPWGRVRHHFCPVLTLSLRIAALVEGSEEYAAASAALRRSNPGGIFSAHTHINGHDRLPLYLQCAFRLAPWTPSTGREHAP